MRPYAFGVDIGGTAVKLGLFQTDGELTEKWSIPTRTVDNGSNVLPDVVISLNQALERHRLDWDQIEGVGMGVPGPVREDGTVMRCWVGTCSTSPGHAEAGATHRPLPRDQ